MTMNMKRLLTLGMVAVLSVAAIAKDIEPPKLKEDKRPIDRSRPEASYSGVVKRVTPSVVTVVSVSTITLQRRAHPFLDDPFLNEMFGIDPRQSRPHAFERKHSGLGSGVILSEDGYILTNNHVVEGADDDGVRVMFANEKKEYTAKVVGKDPQTDIAVLKIEAKGLKPITFGDSDNVEVGDVVLAVGNPFGVGQSVSKGIISALGRTSGILGRGGYEDFIQTDAPINVGNSGGALVDSDGRLIGVNQSIASLSGANAGVGFAVPVNLARSVVEGLITDGKVRRGFLGVGFSPVNEAVMEMLKLPDQGGAVVTGVTPNSAAAKAGLKRYDVITAVNGKKLTDAAQFPVAIAQQRPKSKITLTIIRDAKQKTIEAVLDENPMRLASISRDDESIKPATGDVDLLKGVTLGNLDSRIRKQRKIPAEVKGVLVTEIDSEAPASDQLQAGDVIVEVNREPVETADEVRKLAGATKGQRVMLLVWTDSDGNGFTRLVVLGGR